MFKVTAETVDEYFRADPSREPDLRETDALIRRAAPDLQRHFVRGTAKGRPGMSMTMIGYGRFQYVVKSSSEPIEWPIVGLALQKNYLSLYTAPRHDGSSFITARSGDLGRVKLGGNHLSYVRFADLAADEVATLLEKVNAASLAGEQFGFGRISGTNTKAVG